MRYFCLNGRVYTDDVDNGGETQISFCVSDSTYIIPDPDCGDTLMLASSPETGHGYQKPGYNYIQWGFDDRSMDEEKEILKQMHGAKHIGTYPDITCNGLKGSALLFHNKKTQGLHCLISVGDGIYLNMGVYCVSLNNTEELREIKDFCKTDMVKRIFDTIRIENPNN